MRVDYLNLHNVNKQQFNVATTNESADSGGHVIRC